KTLSTPFTGSLVSGGRRSDTPPALLPVLHLSLPGGLPRRQIGRSTPYVEQRNGAAPPRRAAAVLSAWVEPRRTGTGRQPVRDGPPARAAPAQPRRRSDVELRDRGPPRPRHRRARASPCSHRASQSGLRRP